MDILISKKELIEKIEQARAESHKRAKTVDDHLAINRTANDFIDILNECTIVEANNE